MKPPSSDDSCYETGFPSALRSRELDAIRTRRQSAGLPAEPGDALPAGTVGLAFSGGGIRSATFCLGVLQALARARLLRRVDYLSTVSGGSYIGSFFGALFTRAWTREAAGKLPVEVVEDTLADSYSAPLRWLRDNGRYLSPNGGGDALLNIAVYLRSWVGLHFLLSIFVLMFFLGANLLRQPAWGSGGIFALFEGWLAAHAADSGLWWSPWIVLPGALLALAVTPLGWAYWLTQRDTHDLGSRLPAYVTFAVLVAATAVACLDFLQPTPLGRPAALLADITALALGFWGLAAWRARSTHPPTRLRYTRNRLSQWLSSALSLTGALALFALIDSLGQTLYSLVPLASPHPLATLAGATGFAAFIGAAQRIAVYFSSKNRDKTARPGLPAALIATAAALVLSFAILTAWAAAAHAVLWAGAIPHENPGALILARRAPPAPDLELDPERRIVVPPAAPAQAVAPGLAQPPFLPVALAFLGALVLSALLGRSMKFLNLSSQQTIYNARLSRAYLGASNPARWSGPGQRLSDVIDGDAISGAPGGFWAMPYRPDAHGGPLHLINVTLNETVDGRTQVEQRDRKGLPMAAGPCGLSVGVRSHALWHDAKTAAEEDARYCKIEPLISPSNTFHPLSDNGSKPRCVERLDLGTWVAVSGAAFSTGLGAKTQLGMSILAGLLNVRLGYWWDSLVEPRKRHARVTPKLPQRVLERIAEFFPAQMHLLDEFLARFHGAARRRWYLSDGGHFENTGVYELLRRRVPFIVLCDDGQDAAYTFGDASDLVRKARLDFQAEIRFLTGEELAALLPAALLPLIGSLQQLHRSIAAPGPTHADLEGRFAAAEYSASHAALAWIFYENAPQPASLLLLLKPSLTGDEPLDVLGYHRARPDFPQESTADQFFNEAQWESYRRLGEHIATAVFAKPAEEGKWSPSEFRAPL